MLRCRIQPICYFNKIFSQAAESQRESVILCPLVLVQLLVLPPHVVQCGICSDNASQFTPKQIQWIILLSIQSSLSPGFWSILLHPWQPSQIYNHRELFATLFTTFIPMKLRLLLHFSILLTSQVELIYIIGDFTEDLHLYHYKKSHRFSSWTLLRSLLDCHLNPISVLVFQSYSIHKLCLEEFQNGIALSRYCWPVYLFAGLSASLLPQGIFARFMRR